MIPSPCGLLFLSTDRYDQVYGPEERSGIERLMRIGGPLLTEKGYHATAQSWPEVDFLFASWGIVRFDEAFLRRFPNLKAIFYGAGSVKGLVTEAFWERNIALSTAAAANAVPVAEFTVSQILYALKQGWQQVLRLRRERTFPYEVYRPPGNFGSTVALLSLGLTGRLVAERLRPFDHHVIAYDPFVSDEAAAALNVEKVSLEEAFARADVVSCHTPLLKETEGMIEGRHFDLMKPSATFINTARGAVVREGEMIEVLSRRPDLLALLDVTSPEPPAPDSPLYQLDNVILTPHLAGSSNLECRRLGRAMVEEAARYLRGESLLYSVDRAQVERMA
ncbi:Phosphoglycerate dehydrogenase [Verrucomicrobium sp. GAS474]|uniref:hydroxyacid dehydrogenase n=1 Tax=Verrucomicrobium sp. GAS474 TaxID=1882831 RepID=UPI00087B307F|nr:hydroxyacid dehydrogenase [Verrucomicrobium sp. GAS474]SDU11583.1 Phosphoglycerate dehydrogenase [Verrucomicrobium sp. GAS474]